MGCGPFPDGDRRMRQIGSFSDREQATTFTDYLVSQGVAAVCEPNSSTWEVWVRDEDRVEESRESYRRFRAEPNAAEYRDAVVEAAKLRQQDAQRRRAAAVNYVDVRRQLFHQPLIRRAPLTATLIALSTLVTFASDRGRNAESLFYRGLGFTDLRDYRSVELAPKDGLASIRKGEVWRLVTPIFLHFGLMHLVFNMVWLYVLGVPIEIRNGRVWLGLAVLAAAVAGNVGQYVAGQSALFGGMSGVVYGLLGYTWVRQQFAPREQLTISHETLVFMLIFLVVGFTGAIDGIAGGAIANWAHLFGLAAGTLVGFLKPVEPPIPSIKG